MEFESSRARRIRSSPNMMVAMAARELAAAGRDIIDLSIGEPDFDPPGHVSEAARRAISAGRVRYTGPSGVTSLREAIVDKFHRDNALSFHPEEITIANGAKQILFDAFLATLEAGDEVILPTPCWASYSDIVLLNDGVPKLAPCSATNGFKLTAEALAEAITPSTRWLMLNSPGNPAGAVYTRAEYAALAAVLSRHPRVLILCDEIYEHIVFGPAVFVSFAAACPDLRDRTLIVNGVSKAYSMTGWRVGYAAGPRPLISVINKLQSQSVTSVCSIAQAAAEAALNGPQGYVHGVVTEYAARRDLVVGSLKRIDGLEIAAPDGAFYGFVDVSRALGNAMSDGCRLDNDIDVATHLLRAHGVAAVPGSAFFDPTHIRLSFAASRDALSAAMARLNAMMLSLRPADAITA